MCFNVRDNRVQVAQKDTPCYKIVHQHPKSKSHVFSSQVKRFEYERGFHYTNDNFPKVRTGKRALNGEGLHSYNHLYRVENSAVEKLRNTDLNIRCVAIRCYIPKGGRFLISGDEYISSDLVVVGVLTNKRVAQLKKQGAR